MTAGAMPRWYRVLRAAVFVLLCVNTAYYVAAASVSKGLDSVAWLVLLVLYSIETSHAALMNHRAAASVLRAMRLLAALGVVAAGVGYIIEGDALDALNTGLWIAVVCLLEFEVRRPQAVARSRVAFVGFAGVIYGGLALLVFVWAWRGEWLDAYDALLWLIAFAAIEMDMLAPARAAA